MLRFVFALICCSYGVYGRNIDENSGDGSRDGKIFNTFQIVRFSVSNPQPLMYFSKFFLTFTLQLLQNDPCTGNTRNGTCFTKWVQIIKLWISLHFKYQFLITLLHTDKNVPQWEELKMEPVPKDSVSAAWVRVTFWTIQTKSCDWFFIISSTVFFRGDGM